MDYDIGRIGRVIVARGFEGEDIYAQVEAIASRENIRAATVLLVGGVRAAKVVVGPKSPTGPIEPQYTEFDDAREIAVWARYSGTTTSPSCISTPPSDAATRTSSAALEAARRSSASWKSSSSKLKA